MQAIDQVKGLFFLRGLLKDHCTEEVSTEIIRIFNEKYQQYGRNTAPLCGTWWVDNKLAVAISVEDEILCTLLLKKGATGYYLPKEMPPKKGLSLDAFEKAFRPGVFNVSDKCIDNVVNFIHDWKNLSKNRLRQYRFQPKINDNQFHITIYRDNIEYDTFSSPV